jgi:hypothetical protein
MAALALTLGQFKIARVEQLMLQETCLPEAEAKHSAYIIKALVQWLLPATARGAPEPQVKAYGINRPAQ